MRPGVRGWDERCGLAPGGITSPETGPGEEGRAMSVFVPFVTDTQLFLNYQPFSPLKMRLFCSLLLSSLFSKAQRKAPLGQKANGCCLFSATRPHPKNERPFRFLPQKQTAGQCLFSGLCLWWFLLNIISLYISRQLAGSHLILTGLENLISCTRKALES